jgi:hypothetical protein
MATKFSDHEPLKSSARPPPRLKTWTTYLLFFFCPTPYPYIEPYNYVVSHPLKSLMFTVQTPYNSLQEKRLQFFLLVQFFADLTQDTATQKKRSHVLAFADPLFLSFFLFFFRCDPREPRTWLSLWDPRRRSRGSRRHGSGHHRRRRRSCGLRRPASEPARRWCRRIAAVCHGGPVWPREPRSPPPLQGAEGVSPWAWLLLLLPCLAKKS